MITKFLLSLFLLDFSLKSESQFDHLTCDIIPLIKRLKQYEMRR